MCVQSLDHVLLFGTLWIVTRQASLSMKFSRLEYRSQFPPPGDLPDPGIEPASTVSSAQQGILYHLSHQRSLFLRKIFSKHPCQNNSHYFKFNIIILHFCNTCCSCLFLFILLFIYCLILFLNFNLHENTHWIYYPCHFVPSAQHRA